MYIYNKYKITNGPPTGILKRNLFGCWRFATSHLCERKRYNKRRKLFEKKNKGQVENLWKKIIFLISLQIVRKKV